MVATEDSALSLMQDALNLARRAMGVGLIKPALDSTNDLLNTIRESMADRPEYIELEQSCSGVCAILSRGMGWRQGNHLSQSGLEAIEELATIVGQIKRNLSKRGKRRLISRILRPKKDKEAIVTWILILNRILCVLDAEFGSNTLVTVSGSRRDASDPHTTAPDVYPGNSSIETAALPPPHHALDSCTAISHVPAEVVSCCGVGQETHHNATKNSENRRDPGHSTHVGAPDRLLPPPREKNSDFHSNIERTHAIVDIHETVNGMPQPTSRDKHQGVSDPHIIPFGVPGRTPTIIQAEESVPGELPPPPPRIFGRDELVKEIVDLVDADDPTPIALIGSGGIGKTSVALAILHDNRIKQRFGAHRRLLRCDQFSASLPNFLRRLSEVIGACVENPMELASLRPFLSRERMFLVIDNAEPILGGPNTEDIVPVVEGLTRFKNIYVCITSRTSIVPSHCKLINVPTLSMEAARKTFYSVYRHSEQPDTVNNLLKQLDFHPLSITLLATAAKHNKWSLDQLEKEWGKQRTRVLRTRYDGSLAATIELSLQSPSFRDLGPHARDLLGVVAFFPQGVDENNLDWLFPSVTDGRNIFNHFCILSLTHRNKGFITMLAPLRDYLCPEDPTSASLLCSVKGHYFSRLALSVEAVGLCNDETQWITSEDANAEHVLDIFTSADANSEDAWDACENLMIHLYFHKPRLPVFEQKIRRLPDGYPSKPHCLSRLSSLFSAVGNIVGEQQLLCHALKLYRERGDDDDIAITLLHLSSTSCSLGLHEEGIQQAREAMAIFQRLGITIGVVDCHAFLSSLFRRVNRLNEADECETQAIRLADALIPDADPVLCGSLHASLAVIYFNRGNMEKAVSHTGANLGVLTTRSNRFHNHCAQASTRIMEGRFGDAEAHLERAGSLAANGSSELGTLMLMRACLFRGQGKFAEARSETLCAVDLLEELGGGDRVEEAKDLLDSIDLDMVGFSSMGDLQASVARWTELRKICAGLGWDISRDEQKHRAITNVMALLEKDTSPAGGPDLLQIRKAQEALIDHSCDEEVNEAIAESLAIPTSGNEPDKMLPPKALMCRDSGPVAIWTTDPKAVHVGQLWQALYHVPQVRHRISQYRGPHQPGGVAKAESSLDGTGGYVSSVQELFGRMELSGPVAVTDKLLMEQFSHRSWEGISPCEDVEEAYKEFSERVEINLDDGLATRHPNWPRLFYSRINDATSRERRFFDAKKDFCLISVGYNDGDGSSDLMGCLGNQVFPKVPTQGPLETDCASTSGRAVMESADVLAIALARDEGPLTQATGKPQQRRRFSFPESFCLDQFVATGRERAQNTNVAEGEILRLLKAGSELTKLDNKDVMKSIVSSLHYYEDVAHSPVDVERRAAIESSVLKLRNIIAHIESEHNAIAAALEQLGKESTNLASTEQRQQNKYDLRAVLMHDGLKGLGHVYSYINHNNTWWKAVGYTVTQVAFETVLNDEAGINLGAGPFFLIYSRSLPEPLKSEWPETLEITYDPDLIPSKPKSPHTA